MKVEDIITELIRVEGGFVNDPDDLGGPTKYGITLRTLSEWRASNCTIEDVKNLGTNEARDIYLSEYYYEPQFNLLPEDLQAQLVDMAVQHDPVDAVRMLQEVCSLAGFQCKPDGKLGPITRGVVAKAYLKMGPFLINAISERREQYYYWLIQKRPVNKKYEKGWIKRARSFRVNV